VRGRYRAEHLVRELRQQLTQGAVGSDLFKELHDLVGVLHGDAWEVQQGRAGALADDAVGLADECVDQPRGDADP